MVSFRILVALVNLVLVMNPSAGKRDVGEASVGSEEEPSAPTTAAKAAAFQAHGPKGSDSISPMANAELKGIMAKGSASILEMKQDKMTEMDENSDAKSVFNVSDSGVGSDSLHPGSTSRLSSEIENEISSIVQENETKAEVSEHRGSHEGQKPINVSKKDIFPHRISMTGSLISASEQTQRCKKGSKKKRLAKSEKCPARRTCKSGTCVCKKGYGIHAQEGQLCFKKNELTTFDQILKYRQALLDVISFDDNLDELQRQLTSLWSQAPAPEAVAKLKRINEVATYQEVFLFSLVNALMSDKEPKNPHQSVYKFKAEIEQVKWAKGQTSEANRALLG